MYDPVLKFKKAPDADVAKYAVAWSKNGAAAGGGDVTRTATGDAVGYSVKFSVHNPGITLVDGDIVGAAVRAVDGGGLASAEVAPAAVTVPSEPPGVPTTVALTLS